MVRRRIDINIFPPFAARISRVWVRRVSLNAMEIGHDGEEQVTPREDYQLGVVIADDDTVRRLNNKHRGVDQVTDVLSFSTISQGCWAGDLEPTSKANGKGPFLLPPHEPQPLGEVIISYPQVERQARASGEQIEQELALLLVHGVLHLLGYDHAEPKEEAAMKALEQQALGRLN